MSKRKKKKRFDSFTLHENKLGEKKIVIGEYFNPQKLEQGQVNQGVEGDEDFEVRQIFYSSDIVIHVITFKLLFSVTAYRKDMGQNSSKNKW